MNQMKDARLASRCRPVLCVLALTVGPGLALAQSTGKAPPPRRAVPPAAAQTPPAAPIAAPAAVSAPAGASAAPPASSPPPPAPSAVAPATPDGATAGPDGPALTETVGEARWAPGIGFVRSDDPPARDVRHPKAPALEKPSASLLAKTGSTFAGVVDVVGAGYVHLEPPGGRFGSASGFQIFVFGLEGRWHIRPALLSPWFKVTGGRLGMTLPERVKPEWNPPRVDGKLCDKFTTFSLRTGGSVGLDFAPWEFLALGPLGGLWLTYTEVTFDFPGSASTGPARPSRGDTDYGPGYGIHGRLSLPNPKGILPWVYLDTTMTWRSGRFLKSQDLALEVGAFPGQLHVALVFETRLGTSGRVTYDFQGAPADASNLGEIYAYSMPVNRTLMALVGVAFME